MGTFLAKNKDDDDHWRKLVDQVDNADYTNISLEDTMIYDANNGMAHQWFRIEDFNYNEAFMPSLFSEFDVADLEDLTREQYDNIEFIAFHEDGKFFIQKITKGAYMTKRWFAWNDQIVTYHNESNMLNINPIPHCIYDSNTHILYFMDISKAYGVFKQLKMDYAEATNVDVESFLSSDIVETNGFDISKVGVANRKRINSILTRYNSYTNIQKATLKDYIHDKVGDNLALHDNKFVVSSDKDLRLLLYGIQQRFYVPPLSEETQVATNTTSINNLL